MNKLLSFLVISLFFLSLAPIGSSDIAIYVGKYYYVGNETYGVTQTMIFSYIEGNSVWIMFNSTVFNITSPNDININLTFMHADYDTAGTDDKVLEFNASTNSGTVWFNISGLSGSTDYVVKRNSTQIATPTSDVNGLISFSNDVWSSKQFEIFQGQDIPMTISNPYPTNGSTAIWRPPANLSAYVNGSSLNIYVYFQNLTPATDVWALAESWIGVGSGRYEVTNLSTNFTLKEFVWGNITYTWSVNVSNGTAWNNASYTYTTNTTATGDSANAKYDTNNDNYVDVFDALNIWNSRINQAIYNGIYDVSHGASGNGEIAAQDVLYAWNNRG